MIVAILLVCGGLLFSPAAVTADTISIATRGASGLLNIEYDLSYVEKSLVH